jgi:hypothetical protein
MGERDSMDDTITVLYVHESLRYKCRVTKEERKKLKQL